MPDHTPAPTAAEPDTAHTTPGSMQFTFVAADGTEQTWSPAAHIGHITAIARHLATLLIPGDPVGLLFRSGPDLVCTWFAAIQAGLRPLVMQYPTRKQSRAYWADSVAHTIQLADLPAIIADDHCTALGLPAAAQLIAHATLPPPPTAPTAPHQAVLPEWFEILQLSSGTTGYRKAMVFRSDALARHAHDYNQALDLRPGRDRIVSWLPLYHDMGYVACFVMPILLGIDVVMMDPVDWVANPALLTDAIARHQGTICYMPNFGFEVMARAPARPLPSMRRWISCSEPVSATTASRFMRHIGAEPDLFSPCYAMAENLFAVTLGRGFETRVIDGAEVVSCGPPIPGVHIKTVQGEIWVRSPVSLSAYLGGQDLRDADGYYPTGDLGQILNGELYVAGRKQDVLIQAGRKFMLSDIDRTLNEAYPDIRGRAASLAQPDPRLGTQTPLILIEAVDFFTRTDAPTIAAHMTDLLGIDQLEVAYVPPRFITKTSSGKINRRKTAADWHAARTARTRGQAPRDLPAQLRESFGQVDWDRPIQTVLDSLSTTVIKIMLETTPLRYDGTRTLNELATDLTTPITPSTAATPTGIRIVSLADREVLSRITEADLARLGARLACPVTLEHICLPPSPVLLSDLVFHDWFQPRLPQAPFAEVDSALERLKQASVILVDNVAELKFLYESVYPALSHALERDPGADLICMRWPSYARLHHLLPLSCVSGADIPLNTTNTTLAQLQAYLGIPIFRIASMAGFEAQCAHWDYTWPADTTTRFAETNKLLDTLGTWIAAHDIRQVALPPGPTLMMSDLSHFCAAGARQPVIDRVIEAFDSFTIAGQPASLPYLRQRLDALGKPYTLVPSFAPEIMDQLPHQHACIIACGAYGKPHPTLPFIAFQHVGQAQRLHNLGPLEAELTALGGVNSPQPAKPDWFHSFALERDQSDAKTWRAARQAAAAARTAKNRLPRS